MSRSSYEESGHRVFFDEDWQVLKLDESRFYKYISGVGFKSMDFLIRHEDYGIVLIELKNYRDQDDVPPQDVVEDIFLAKSEDSLHLIEIMDQYLRRRRRYRLALRYNWIFRWLTPEWKLWWEIIKDYRAGRVILLGDIEWW